MAEFTLLGKRVPPLDGAERATGKAQFVTDIKLPGMLNGRVLRSPIPHGRILNIDVSRALRVPGVKAVLTYADTPGVRFGTLVDDWYILARDKVRFVGEEVAAVAALDSDAAEEALGLIQVQYKELPAVFDPEAAMEPGAPLINQGFERNIVSHFQVNRGDVEEAFREADYIYENRYYTNQVYQAYLEPIGCVAEPDPSGKLILWLPIQIPSKARLVYARALGMSPEDIRVIKPFVGGAFGAKMESNLHLICGLLALKTGRPVKMVNTREEDFIAGNPRVPMVIYLRLGFKRNGEITGKQVKVVATNGGRTVYSIPIMGTACFRIDSLYTFKNVKADGYSVYTNTVPTGAFRGFGNAQMTFALESSLDDAAKALGIDPIDLRLVNSPHSGTVSAHGWKLSTVGLQECLQRVKEASDWDSKRRERAPNRGIGVACCNHVSGYKAFFPVFDGSSAFIRVGEDGKVVIFHGESDIGQGQTTCFAMIAAEELGVKLEDISVAGVDTQISPFGLGSFASRGTTIGGNAIKAAAADARTKLLLAAGDLLEVPPEALEIKESLIRRRDMPSKAVTVAEASRRYTFTNGGEHLVGRGKFVPDTVVPDPKTKLGNPSPLYPFAAQIAEVEVDPETGQVTLLNFWAAHDVGRVVNLLTLEGQVEGGVSTGIGWALLEDMVTSNGKVQNPNFLDYRIPGPLDLPRINSLFVETNDPNGPFGAKGIGEPALNPVAPAIANAIYDATGLRLRELPFRPEAVFREIVKRRGDG